MKTEQQEHLSACAEYADRLVDLSDGDLPASERLPVEAHLATCRACQSELRRLNVSLATLRSALVVDYQVAAERLAVHCRKSQLRPRRYVVGVSVAAVLALLLLPATAAYVRSLLPKHPAQAPGVPNTAVAVVPGPAASKSTSHDDALRQIALLEQQARLEMSLSLTPQDPWFADQRAANERLLTQFQRATASFPAHE